MLHKLDAQLLDSDGDESQETQGGLTAANLKILNFIDSAFAAIDHALSSAQPPFPEVSVFLRRVNKGSAHSANANVVDVAEDADDIELHRSRRRKSRIVKYCWPGDTQEEAERFTQLLAIFGEIRKAILTSTVMTKRDIYYRQPELFGKQGNVDKWIDDIAFTCGAQRQDLMVTASPKGLICGLDGNEHENRMQTVPAFFADTTFDDINHLKWILVVEKEASFKTLVEQNFDSHPALGRGLIVTAKGYPDLHTRRFLRHVLQVSAIVAQPPLFGFFDGDPDGLDICHCYQSGCSDVTQDAEYNLPEMKWLGIDICEHLGEVKTIKQALPLSTRDRGRARSMLARQYQQSARTTRMLRTMLMLGVKIEIQAIDQAADRGLYGWLEGKIANHRA